MQRKTTLPSAEYLRECFAYDPATGRMTWRRERNGIAASTEAGSLSVHGYRVVCLDYKRYFVHRIIWKMQFGADPKEHIDHIDCNPLNNRIENLRAASGSENSWNARTPKDNTSGVKGVHWDTERRAWFAQITIGGKRIPLGRYRSLDEATIVRQRAAARLHGDFVRHA